MFEFILYSINSLLKITAFVLITDNLTSNKLSKSLSENEKINKICTNTVLIAKSIKTVILNKFLNNEPTKIAKNRYVLTYKLNNKQYFIIINKKSGPKKYIQAIDENNEDITNLISSFAGPGSDFHNSKITPGFLKFKEITFNLVDGESITFKENEELIL